MFAGFLGLWWIKWADPGFWVGVATNVALVWAPQTVYYAITRDAWGWFWNVGLPAGKDILLKLVQKMSWWAKAVAIAKILSGWWWLDIAISVVGFIATTFVPMVTPPIGFC